jgi:hypothetical protein
MYFLTGIDATIAGRIDPKCERKEALPGPISTRNKISIACMFDTVKQMLLVFHYFLNDKQLSTHTYGSAD